jgi:hypothetical protein
MGIKRKVWSIISKLVVSLALFIDSFIAGDRIVINIKIMVISIRIEIPHVFNNIISPLRFVLVTTVTLRSPLDLP